MRKMLLSTLLLRGHEWRNVTRAETLQENEILSSIHCDKDVRRKNMFGGKL